MGTRVDGTAINNDGPTQSNRGRVAFSFRISNSNKGPSDKCGAIFERHPGPPLPHKNTISNRSNTSTTNRNQKKKRCTCHGKEQAKRGQVVVFPLNGRRRNRSLLEKLKPGVYPVFPRKSTKNQTCTQRQHETTNNAKPKTDPSLSATQGSAPR